MGLDSVELVMEVEKYFSISIPDKEAEKAYSVGKLVDCVGNILGVFKYDFDLRIRTFEEVQIQVKQIIGVKQEYIITDKVKDTIDIDDKELIIQLENLLNFELPGISKSEPKNNALFQKLKTWINFSPNFDFENIRWKKYVDVILAYNLEKIINPINITSKYEIYIALMRIIVDKIGVDYFEIGLEKSFTDDLGVD
jgi:acyl carrier protein